MLTAHEFCERNSVGKTATTMIGRVTGGAQVRIQDADPVEGPKGDGNGRQPPPLPTKASAAA
jgi:hypothetical protein